MKKTSKIMSLVLAGAMVLSMTACAGNTAETTSAAAKTMSETSKVKAPLKIGRAHV